MSQKAALAPAHEPWPSLPPSAIGNDAFGQPRMAASPLDVPRGTETGLAHETAPAPDVPRGTGDGAPVFEDQAIWPESSSAPAALSGGPDESDGLDAVVASLAPRSPLEADPAREARSRARARLIAAGAIEDAPDMALAARAEQRLGIPLEAALFAPEEAARELEALDLAGNAGLLEYGSRDVFHARIARDNASWAADVGRLAAPFSRLSTGSIRTPQDAPADPDAPVGPHGLAGPGAGASLHGLYSSHAVPAPAGDGWLTDYASITDFSGTSWSQAARDAWNGAYRFARNLNAALWNGLVDINSNVWSAADSILEMLGAKPTGQAGVGERLKMDPPRADSPLGQFFYDAMGIAPQQAVNIGLGLGGGAASLMAFMGSQIYGSAYGRLRQNQVGPREAAFAAAAGMAPQMLLERLGLGSLLKAISSKSLGEALANASRAGITEGITEALQKGPDYLAHLWGLSSLEKHENLGDRLESWLREATDSGNLATAFAEALYEGAMGAFWGFGLGGASAAVQAGRRRQREQLEREAREARLALLSPAERVSLDAEKRLATQVFQRGVFDEAVPRIIQAARKAADPLARQEVIEASLNDFTRSLWITPDNLRQISGQKDPASLAAALGMDEGQLAAALASPEPVRLDSARILSQEDDDLVASILDASSLGPDAVTGAEARLWNPETRLRGALDVFSEQDSLEMADPGDARAELAREAQRHASFRRHLGKSITALKRQFVGAGMLNEETEHVARLWESAAVALYDRSGLDVSQYIANVLVSRETGVKAAPGKIVRGQTTLGQGGAIIRLFDGRNLSTMAHESMHVFTDLALWAARDNGASALRVMRARLLDLPLPEDGRASLEAELENLALTPDTPQAIHNLRLWLRGKSAEAAAASRQAQEAEDDAAARDFRSQASAWARAARRCEDAGRHFRGLDQLKADLQTLAKDAGLAPGQLEDLIAGQGKASLNQEDDEKLQARIFKHDKRVWFQHLRRAFNRTRPGDPPARMLARAPRVLERLREQGALKSLAPGGLYASPHILDGKHPNITRKMLARLPDAMASPIAVFRSETNPANLVFMLDLKDGKGATVVAPVAINERTKYLPEKNNRIKSVYAKEAGGKPRNDWFLRQLEQNALYVDRDKLDRWLAGNGLEMKKGGGSEVDTYLPSLASQELADGLSQGQSGLMSTTGPSESNIAGGAQAVNKNNQSEPGVRTGNRQEMKKGGGAEMVTYLPSIDAQELAPPLPQGQSGLMSTTGSSDGNIAGGAEAVNKDNQGKPGVLRQEDGEDPWTRFFEHTARQWEQYLMEGRAPTPALRPAFARFRGWLLAIYEKCRHLLGKPLDPDVARVFDRMLATSRQLRQATGYEAVAMAELEFVRGAGLTHEEYSQCLNLLNESDRKANILLDRINSKKWEERRRRRLEETTARLAAEPFWQVAQGAPIARADAAELLGARGAEELAAAAPRLLADDGRPAAEAFHESGGPWADAGEMLADLRQRLAVDGQTLADLAAAETDAWLERRRASAAARGSVLAGDAYGRYLDAVDRITARLAAAKNHSDPQRADAYARAIVTPRSRVSSDAAMAVSSMPIGKINLPSLHARIDMALRDRMRHLAEGNYQAAIFAVHQARVANEMISAARGVQRRMDSIRQLAAQVSRQKPGTYGAAHTEALRKLMAAFGLGRPRGVSPDYGDRTLAELVRQITPDSETCAVMPSFDSWLLELRHPRSQMRPQGGHIRFSDLTPMEAGQVENLMRYLVHTGREASVSRKQSFDNQCAADAALCASLMSALPEKPALRKHSLRKALDKLGGKMLGAVDYLVFQCKKGDGLSNLLDDAGQPGPLETCMNEVLECEDRLRARYAQMDKSLTPHLKKLAALMDRLEAAHGRQLKITGSDGNPVTLPQSLARVWGTSYFTADQVIALALNCGNESNMARIRAGFPELSFDTLAELLGDGMARAIFRAGDSAAPLTPGDRPGLLNAGDWRAIQGVWDALGSMWADTCATHERLYGFRPDGIPPRGFHVPGPDGRPVWLEGGYYPVRYDPELSREVAGWQEQDDIRARNESLMQTPAARRGHTKARSKQAPGKPLRLDTGVIMEHVEDAARFIELAEIVRKMDKITMNSDFAARYVNTWGQEDYNAIRPNIRRLVLREQPPRGHAMSDIINAIRPHLIAAGLWGNIKVAVMQITAVFNGMGDLGARCVMGAALDMIRHPLHNYRAIHAASPYMYSRSRSFDEDLRQNARQIGPHRKKSVTIAGRDYTWEDVVKLGFVPLQLVDSVATSIVFMAAYRDYMARNSLTENGAPYLRSRVAFDPANPAHRAAVAHANRIVKQSNPDYNASGRNRFLDDQSYYRLFNGFASATSLLAARHAFARSARQKGRLSRAGMARFEFYETLLPAMFLVFFYALGQGYFSNPDRKDWLNLIGKNFTDIWSQRVPMFGNIASDAIGRALGLDSPAARGIGVRTTIAGPLELAGKTIAAARTLAAHPADMTQEEKNRLLYATLDLIGYAARVNIVRPVKNLRKAEEQRAQRKAGPISPLIPR